MSVFCVSFFTVVQCYVRCLEIIYGFLPFKYHFNLIGLLTCVCVLCVCVCTYVCVCARVINN